MYSNKLTTHVKDKELIIERVFNATKELVFQAFSDSVHLENWWGPEGWETTSKSFEFKPNGVWHYCMRCTDKNQGEFYGQELWGKHIYHDIVALEKIVYTDAFSDEEGNISDHAPGNLITLMFEEESGETKLTMSYKLDSTQNPQKVIDSGFIQGLGSSFNRLDTHLEKMR